MNSNFVTWKCRDKVKPCILTHTDMFILLLPAVVLSFTRWHNQCRGVIKIVKTIVPSVGKFQFYVLEIVNL